MSYDKDSVLNALQRTNAAEVKLHYEAENTVALTADCEEMFGKHAERAKPVAKRWYKAILWICGQRPHSYFSMKFQALQTTKFRQRF